MSRGYTFRVCTSSVYNSGVFICLEGIHLECVRLVSIMLECSYV